MDITFYVTMGVLVVVLLWAIAIYNSLVSIKHNVQKAWSNIDVLLKQRHDELPKLVETCKQYMKHERETLEKVTQARSAVANAQAAQNMNQLGAAETQLRLGLGSLFAVAESYPELKADESFQHLQRRITNLENEIADRREFYNESVNINNVRIEQFPDVLVARIFGFREADLLYFTEAEKSDVDVKQLFS